MGIFCIKVISNSLDVIMWSAFILYYERLYSLQGLGHTQLEREPVTKRSITDPLMP